MVYYAADQKRSKILKNFSMTFYYKHLTQKDFMSLKIYQIARNEQLQSLNNNENNAYAANMSYRDDPRPKDDFESLSNHFVLS